MLRRDRATGHDEPDPNPTADTDAGEHRRGRVEQTRAAAPLHGEGATVERAVVYRWRRAKE